MNEAYNKTFSLSVLADEMFTPTLLAAYNHTKCNQCMKINTDTHLMKALPAQSQMLCEGWLILHE